MRTDPEKLKAWKKRSAEKAFEKKKRKYADNPNKVWNKAEKINPVSNKRRTQNSAYGKARKEFLRLHPICPVTGEPSTEIHHTAHREGAWLLLERYWVAVSRAGHRYIENNKEWSYKNGLLVKANALYNHHCENLLDEGLSLTKPAFYETWNGKPLCPRK
jgi:hypothetical protein